MTTEDNYSTVREAVYGEIYRKLERKDDERVRFAPRGTLRRILRRNDDALLKRILRSLSVETTTTDAGSTMLILDSDIIEEEEEYIKRVEQRNLFNLIGTLLFATCSIHAAKAVVRVLIAPPTITKDQASLSELPLSRNRLEQLFPDANDADRFSSQQACFCPVVLRDKDEVVILDARSYRLPYLSEELRGEGSFGKVFRIEVARNHFWNAESDASNDKPREMARKDYVFVDTKNKAKDEYKIMMQILNSRSSHENILQSLGCLQIGPHYSLFMPLAICDLNNYIRKHHPNPPQGIAAKVELIQCAAGLSSGLHFLHTGIQTRDHDELVCYHMDLNPANILIFRHRQGFLWKISDFGMSRVKVKAAVAASSGGEKDVNSLFVRRLKPQQQQNPSLPPTINRRGEATYLAPESISANPTMRTSSDVWALGCVLSVVFAYMAGGAMGVENYCTARQQHPKADGFDRFFIRRRQFMSHKVSPAVASWHRKLIRNARSDAEIEALFTMLTFLENHVLKENQSLRCNANEVAKSLKNCGQRLGEACETNSARRPSTIQVVKRRRLDKLRIRPLSQSKTKTALLPLATLTTQDFKGCAFAPDANSLVYWSDGEIVLYTSNTLSFTDGNILGNPARWSLNTISPSNSAQEGNCILKNACLTDRYLVVSTAGTNYLYIFDLIAGEEVDSTLRTMWRLSIDFPGIDSIAISPNSQILAFVARNSTTMGGNATLVYCSMSQLLRFAKVESRSISGQSDDPKPEVPFHSFVKLPWPSTELIELSVSNTYDVYFVVRPELTLRSRELKTAIVHVSIDHTLTPPLAAINILNMIPKGYDVTATSSFFTSFCLIYDKDMCAVVTRAKNLRIAKFTGNCQVREMQQDILGYRFSKVFCCHPGRGGLHAVGYRSSKQQMLLLQIQLSPKLSVTKITKFPGLKRGDEFAVVTAQGPQKDKVIIASLTGASRGRVYRVSVPHH